MLNINSSFCTHRVSLLPTNQLKPHAPHCNSSSTMPSQFGLADICVRALRCWRFGKYWSDQYFRNLHIDIIIAFLEFSLFHFRVACLVDTGRFASNLHNQAQNEGSEWQPDAPLDYCSDVGKEERYRSASLFLSSTTFFLLPFPIILFVSLLPIVFKCRSWYHVYRFYRKGFYQIIPRFEKACPTNIGGGQQTGGGNEQTKQNHLELSHF